MVTIRELKIDKFSGQQKNSTGRDVMICAILHMLLLTTLPSFSPAKNVWLVDARPRDIAKFKMAAIPASFVYSSGKKINCGLI